MVENVHNKELIYINYMVQNAEILPKVLLYNFKVDFCGRFKWNPDHEEELRSAFSFVKTKNKLPKLSQIGDNIVNIVLSSSVVLCVLI